MSLPIVSLPKYDLTLPSSGKKIQYRPFVVKEQKVMLTAVELGDAAQLNNAIRDIIDSCTYGKLNLNEMPIYEIEYLMLNIRKHSVGEVLELNYKCNHVHDDGNKCVGKMVSFLNLSEVSVNFPPDHVYDLKLSDSMGMKLKDISYDLFNSLTNADVDTITSSIDTIINCIDSIYDEDGVYLVKDYSREDLVDWIESLAIEDFNTIELFLDTMPTLTHEIQLKCPKCGSQDKATLSGLEDFLD